MTMLDEFSLITNCLAGQVGERADVLLGIGDDCALLQVPPQKVLAVSIDTMVENVHFFPEAPPYFIGYKSLSVSLSDMAAMGAEPAWVTLALTLPSALAEYVNAAVDGSIGVDIYANASVANASVADAGVADAAVNSAANVGIQGWLSEFYRGFRVLLERYKLQLVGGNMSCGRELAVTTQLHGFLPQNKSALRRDGARVGDMVYVTGNLGDAGLALQLMHKLRATQQTLQAQQLRPLWQRLYCQTPRIAEGRALLDAANAAIDISDGLLADLGHILERSQVGATIYTDKLPLSPWLREHADSLEVASNLALSAGDDYELCFTAAVAPDISARLNEIARECNCIFTPVGVIEKQLGLRVMKSEAGLAAATDSNMRSFWTSDINRGDAAASKKDGYVHTWKK